jgi:hypothetical protein
MLRQYGYEFHKKHTGTRYAKLVFLHPLGSVGHVVHSGASGLRNVNAQIFMLRQNRYEFHKKCVGVRNIDAPFFMLGCDRYEFHKKRTKSHYTIFHAWARPV